MKKLLITILIVLLSVLTYLLIFKNVKAFNWSNKNIEHIKQMNAELDNEINTAKQIANQDYPEKLEQLDNSIRQMKISKEKYEAKINSMNKDAGLGIIEIKQYKIERLWITLASYAQNHQIDLVLDLMESSNTQTDTYAAKLYDLKITLVGDYIGITDFIYDIENDDTLNFKITNFNLAPTIVEKITTTQTEETNNESDSPEQENNETDNKGENEGNNENKTEETTTYVVGNDLKATFRIESVGIELD